ncbi:MAG: hypothetical protein M3070_07195 [Actinomycetota bacterium]|nr:hypothetical protein [Actinomycetota bacterium]
MGSPATTTRIVATLVGIAYAVVLYVSGVHLQDGAKKIVAYLPAIATLLLAVWDLWLWRLPGVQRFAKRPWITGTWSVNLRPTDDSHIPEGGNRGPIEAYIIVTQSYWSISVRQYTAESRSESQTAVWSKTSGGNLLTFIYANRPMQELEARSRPHFGATTLDLVGLRPSSITGEYFTDRYTKGDMQLRLVDRSTDHADFASTRAHCDE